MAFKFTSAECATAANELTTSASNIGNLIDKLLNIYKHCKFYLLCSF